MPGITICTETERIPLIFADPGDPNDISTIFYRRVPNSEYRRILSDNTGNMGAINMVAVRSDLCTYAIRGWENVPDATGTITPFDEALIQKLPPDVITVTSNKLLEATADHFLPR